MIHCSILQVYPRFISILQEQVITQKLFYTSVKVEFILYFNFAIFGKILNIMYNDFNIVISANNLVILEEKYQYL